MIKIERRWTSANNTLTKCKIKNEGNKIGVGIHEREARARETK